MRHARRPLTSRHSSHWNSECCRPACTLTCLRSSVLTATGGWAQVALPRIISRPRPARSGWPESLLKRRRDGSFRRPVRQYLVGALVRQPIRFSQQLRRHDLRLLFGDCDRAVGWSAATMPVVSFRHLATKINKNGYLCSLDGAIAFFKAKTCCLIVCSPSVKNNPVPSYFANLTGLNRFGASLAWKRFSAFDSGCAFDNSPIILLIAFDPGRTFGQFIFSELRVPKSPVRSFG